jgi:hypothetical protein
MIPKILRNSLVLAILILSCAGMPGAFAEVQRVYGQAFNLDGELEYMEEHLITYENDRIVAIETTFYDAAAQKIAQQVSEFTQGAQFGSYDFVDERHRYSDGARVMSDRILIYSKKNPSTDKKQKYLSKKPNQIVGQGFYQFVAANLDALARGESLTAKLVLPAQMNQFNVKISKKQVQGNRIQLKVELDNWFLRIFTPEIQVEYDLASRRLLWYRGISMVSNADKKNVEVLTTYDYPQKPSMLGARDNQAGVASQKN